MNKAEYITKLTESISGIMAATIMDSANQGDNLQAAARTFAENLMDGWLWKQIDIDARSAADFHVRMYKKTMVEPEPGIS